MQRKQYVLTAISSVLASCIISQAALASDNHISLTELQKLVISQQQQLAKQSRQLQLLSQRLNQLQHKSNTTTPAKPVVHPVRQPSVSSNNSYVQLKRITPDQYPVFIQASSQPQSILIPSHQLIIGTDKANLTLSGFVNSAVMNADDGKSDNTFYVFNSPDSRINANVQFIPTKDWTVGAKLQLGFNINSANVVSQTTPTSTPAIDMRKVEIFVTSKYLGSIMLGKGKTATDDIAYSDFSGTMMLGRATLQDIGGGLFYRDSDSGLLTSTTVGNTVNGLDGFGRAMRLRYDTPSFYGVNLSGSVIDRERQDIAIKFGRKIDDTKVAAQVGFTSPQAVGSGTSVAGGHVMNTSAGVLFDNGINMSVSWAELFAKQLNRDNPYYFYLKPGYQRQFFSVGISAFSVDMGRYYNFSQNDDRATSYGVQYAQSINPWDLALYVGYRHFHLHRTTLDLDNLNLFLAGAMFKF